MNKQRKHILQLLEKYEHEDVFITQNLYELEHEIKHPELEMA